MKYLIGLFIGLIIGIVLFIIWKKIFGKYLPMEDSVLLNVICAIGYFLVCMIMEDSVLLNVICAIGYFLVCMISGALVASFNIYAIFIGIVLLSIALIISYGFGIYYKVTATNFCY